MRHDLRLCGQRNLTVGVVTGSVVLGHSRCRVRFARIYRRVAKWLRPLLITGSSWVQFPPLQPDCV